MKLWLCTLALCLMLTSTFGFKVVEHKNGQDVLKLLEEGDNTVYVIMFFVPGKDGSVHNVKTVEDEKELIARVLNRFPSFYYAKVNAADPNYADLVKACGIIVNELPESPSVLIIEGGVGVWVHGPQTINKVEEFAVEYQRRSTTSH